MWDIIVPLILLAIFYLVPEILKRKRRQAEYKYPEIPDQVPPPMETRAPTPGRVPPEQRRLEERPVRVPASDVGRPPASDERPRPAASAAVFQQSEVQIAAVDMSAAAKVSSAMSEAGPWDGQLTQEAVVNGIIFAEVIQPPRCKRPMRSPFQRG